MANPSFLVRAFFRWLHQMCQWRRWPSATSPHLQLGCTLVRICSYSSVAATADSVRCGGSRCDPYLSDPDGICLPLPGVCLTVVHCHCVTHTSPLAAAVDEVTRRQRDQSSVYPSPFDLRARSPVSTTCPAAHAVSNFPDSTLAHLRLAVLGLFLQSQQYKAPSTYPPATMPSGSGSDPLLARADGMADSAVAAVDHRGRPASRASTGRWRSALFIIAVEIAERFAFYGVSANLISYLTGPLGEGNAKAAAAINAWNGVAQLLPLLGAALADSWLGRYRTIVLASLLYILALGMLALSTLLSSGSHQCSNATSGMACPPSALQMAAFYISLYMVAVAQGGHKPCVQAFGADQFDPTDPGESVSRGSFFNWWYFGMCAGSAVTLVFLSYIQDNIGWGLGFGIPCVVMACALAVFLLGTRTYRYYYVSGSKQQSLFSRAGEAFAAWRSRRKSIPLQASASHDDCHQSATLAPEYSARVDEEEQEVVSTTDLVEEAKGILRLFPIWATCLIYAVAFSQSSTFFTKQAATLDRRVGERLQVPPAALQSFISITIVAFIPIYDRAIVPLARRYSGVSSGITMLQRIGAGMVLSLMSMVIAALVEAHRLRVARDAGLADKPKVPVPMSLWWMVPQYMLFGAADVFTMVGLQEFFYDQVPDKLRSLGMALYLSIFGVGSFISSGLVSGIDRVTAARGQSWFSNNLNRGHLDYFYWLLAALSALELLAYVVFAMTFKYKNKGAVIATTAG